MAYDEETLEVFHNLTEEGLEAYRELLMERERERDRERERQDRMSPPERLVEMFVKIFKD